MVNTKNVVIYNKVGMTWDIHSVMSVLSDIINWVLSSAHVVTRKYDLLQEAEMFDMTLHIKKTRLDCDYCHKCKLDLLLLSTLDKVLRCGRCHFQWEIYYDNNGHEILVPRYNRHDLESLLIDRTITLDELGFKNKTEAYDRSMDLLSELR